jgi:hypothetical protein
MIALRRHDHKDYAELPNIDATNVGTLDEGDTACLGEVGECVLQSKANRRFGVGLLHSHFPIDSDETLVKEVHADAEVITLRPMRNAPSSLFATTACFDDAGFSRRDHLRLVGLEFAPKQALAGIVPIGDLDRHVLAGLASILHRHGKIRRFGVRLLHDPLKLNGRVLLETCDSINRVLTCRSTAGDDPAFVQSIATVFCWEEAGAQKDGSTVNQGCMQFCKRIQGCSVDSRGNHKSSSSHQTSHGDGP